MRALLLLPLLLVACGDADDIDTEAEGCDACLVDEVCVIHMGDDGDTEACAPIPDECGDEAACGDNTCVSALYGLCDDDWIGVGCSDTLAPTLVSCNP